MSIALEVSRVRCPFCGEGIELLIDKSVATQEYIEDCQVCCRPIRVSVEIADGGETHVMLRDENET